MIIASFGRISSLQLRSVTQHARPRRDAWQAFCDEQRSRTFFFPPLRIIVLSSRTWLFVRHLERITRFLPASFQALLDYSCIAVWGGNLRTAALTQNKAHQPDPRLANNTVVQHSTTTTTVQYAVCGTAEPVNLRPGYPGSAHRSQASFGPPGLLDPRTLARLTSTR